MIRGDNASECYYIILIQFPSTLPLHLDEGRSLMNFISDLILASFYSTRGRIRMTNPVRGGCFAG